MPRVVVIVCFVDSPVAFKTVVPIYTDLAIISFTVYWLDFLTCQLVLITEHLNHFRLDTSHLVSDQLQNG
jgi:hypothetical protein